MDVRCLKCKKQVQPVDTAIVSMNNPKNPKQKALKGKCPDCGTKVFRMLKNDAGTA